MKYALVIVAAIVYLTYRWLNNFTQQQIDNEGVIPLNVGDYYLE